MKSQRTKLCFITTNCQRSCSDKRTQLDWNWPQFESNPRLLKSKQKKTGLIYVCVLGLGKLLTTSMLFILVNKIISELSRKRQGACIESDHLCLANRACDATLKSAPPPPPLHQRRPTLLNFSFVLLGATATLCCCLRASLYATPPPPTTTSPLLSSHPQPKTSPDYNNRVCQPQ